MTDLRDQLAGRAIRIDHDTDIGRIIAQLRRDAGYTGLSLARRLHISRSGIAKRENTASMSTAALVAHLAALGYDLALIPRTDRRTTP